VVGRLSHPRLLSGDKGHRNPVLQWSWPSPSQWLVQGGRRQYAVGCMQGLVLSSLENTPMGDELKWLLKEGGWAYFREPSLSKIGPPNSKVGPPYLKASPQKIHIYDISQGHNFCPGVGKIANLSTGSVPSFNPIQRLRRLILLTT